MVQFWPKSVRVRNSLCGPRRGYCTVLDTAPCTDKVKPAAVVLQIGQNDLNSPSFVNVVAILARDIFSVAQWLIEGFSVSQVGIMQLLPGLNTRHIPIPVYSRGIDQVNAELKALCGGSTHCFVLTP